jgi:hypothetical protein
MMQHGGYYTTAPPPSSYGNGVVYAAPRAPIQQQQQQASRSSVGSGYHSAIPANGGGGYYPPSSSQSRAFAQFSSSSGLGMPVSANYAYASYAPSYAAPRSIPVVAQPQPVYYASSNGAPPAQVWQVPPPPPSHAAVPMVGIPSVQAGVGMHGGARRSNGIGGRPSSKRSSSVPRSMPLAAPSQPMSYTAPYVAAAPVAPIYAPAPVSYGSYAVQAPMLYSAPPPSMAYPVAAPVPLYEAPISVPVAAPAPAPTVDQSLPFSIASNQSASANLTLYGTEKRRPASQRTRAAQAKAASDAVVERKLIGGRWITAPKDKNVALLPGQHVFVNPPVPSRSIIPAPLPSQPLQAAQPYNVGGGGEVYGYDLGGYESGQRAAGENIKANGDPEFQPLQFGYSFRPDGPSVGVSKKGKGGMAASASTSKLGYRPLWKPSGASHEPILRKPLAQGGTRLGPTPRLQFSASTPALGAAAGTNKKADSPKRESGTASRPQSAKPPAAGASAAKTEPLHNRQMSATAPAASSFATGSAPTASAPATTTTTPTTAAPTSTPPQAATTPAAAATTAAPAPAKSADTAKPLPPPTKDAPKEEAALPPPRQVRILVFSYSPALVAHHVLTQ